MFTREIRVKLNPLKFMLSAVWFYQHRHFGNYPVELCGHALL